MNFKDVRLRAVLLTFALVLIVVSFVSYWPDAETAVFTKNASETTSETASETAAPVNSQVKGPLNSVSEAISQPFEQAVKRLRQRQYAEAIEGFREVLRNSPAMPEAYLNMGFAYYELKHYKLAVESFETAIDLRPAQVNAYWGLAVSLEGLCDIAGAIGAMRTYVHLAAPDSAYLKRANAALWEWDQIKIDSKKMQQNKLSCNPVKQQ